MPLPNIMIAPNGARRGKADHPELPITIAETVETARSCHAAGADGIHVHVRDEKGAHTLDAGLYQEAMAELQRVVPAMQVQITTEAVGRYTPIQQRALVQQCQPASVSISIAELFANEEQALNIRFYNDCLEAGIAVHHILYDVKDFQLLTSLFDEGLNTSAPVQLLFVLGRYSVNQQSSPTDLLPFTDELSRLGINSDWSICAFGVGETDCLVAAHAAGGKIRIGFENSLWHADGTIATDNAERVSRLRELLS